ncbi:hypothetical protein CH381_31295 [Leptospira sp. mixed culture ATI2-C-A1]|nr:hypothetical protein CH381_31295 [Leptospira sp. mixed culture ATI2-C-A1]
MRLKSIFYKLSINLLLLILIIQCKVDNRQTTIEKEVTKVNYQISKVLLMNEDWTTYGKLYSYGHGIEFDGKGKFKYEFHGEGGCESNFSGTYFIESNILYMNPDLKNSCLENKNRPPKKISCSIESNPKDPFYEAYLNCGKYSFYGPFLKKTGENINLFGNDAIIILPKKVFSKTNIKVRENPSTNAKFYECNSKSEKNFTNPYLPKGRELKLLARTLNKEVINGIEDYWYFAKEDFDWYESCIVNNKNTSMVWVFGGFVE